MNSVTPMKLIPVSSNETNGNNFVKEFPTISSNEMVIRKQNMGNLTNLDSELLEILHNKDLSDDAKAKLYWIALHKSEVYKDKSMWSEPTIVELRENRFIPIPITKTISSNIESSNLNRKRKVDESEEVLSNKRKKLNDFSSDLDLNVNIQPSRKRKSDNENETSERELKRIALVNRVQNGQITQEELDREEQNIESEKPSEINSNIIEPNLTSGPLVVVNQQDEPQPSISGYNYSPSQFEISENLEKKLQPQWLEVFYSKIDSDRFSPFVKSQIKNIIKKIMEKDDKFKLMGNSIITSQKTKISGDPVTLFSHLIIGKSTTTRALDLLKNYIKDLKIEYQEGSGFKSKIIKWVKL